MDERHPNLAPVRHSDAVSRPLVFERASILCYRIFDVAEEIDLDKANRLLSKDTRRLRLSREGAEYLHLPNPPVVVELGKAPLPLRSGTVQVDVLARIFDHGALSVILDVPVRRGMPIQEVIVLADELYDSKAVDAAALEHANALRRSLQGAIERGHLWDQSESYTVTFVEELQGHPNAAEILENVDLPRLLLGEVNDRPLSERERYEVTQHRFSYTEDDLVVVDWNSAFVYEPSGSMDIPDILEICNAQLLEFRYYDDLLDAQLKTIYDEMQRTRRGWYRVLRSPYRVLARRVLAMVLEISEFVERVENSLKIIGDFYLAKVYEASVRRLRINAWQASVTRKQVILGNVYQLLKGEVDTDRSLTLEATIVLLIVAEILFAFTRVLGPGH